MPGREETFVLIIGGGPVGLTLAIDLGQRGVPAILVTQNLAPPEHPKCNFANTRTMEHFSRMGLVSDVRGDGLPQDFPRAVSFRTRYSSHELGRIELIYLTQAGEQYGPERGHNISQAKLEPILKRHAEAQSSVDVRFGHRLVALEYDQDGATATVEDVSSGVQSTIRARYVAGCDGARSPVRRAIDASMIGESGTAVRNFVSGTMMAYFIQSPNLYAKSEPAKPSIMVWVVNHDARGFVMSQNGRDRFLAHYPVPPGVDWQDLKTEVVLDGMLGPGIDYSLLSAGPWTGGLALVADKYSDGPVFVAGDAAHLFTPLGGFGMNTGIGDAVNLGWKLAAMHQGWGGEGLLDSYAIERHAIGERNSRIGIHCAARKDRWPLPANIEDEGPEADAARKALGDFLAVDDRDEYMTIGVQLGERYISPIIAPASGPSEDPWDRYIPSDEPGGRAPHFALPDGRSLYEAFGDGFAVLAFGKADPASIAEAAAFRGVPLRTVRAPERDPQYRYNLVLVRPDGQIAWSGDNPPAEPLALIDMVRGA